MNGNFENMCIGRLSELCIDFSSATSRPLLNDGNVVERFLPVFDTVDALNVLFKVLGNVLVNDLKLLRNPFITKRGFVRGTAFERPPNDEIDCDEDLERQSRDAVVFDWLVAGVKRQLALRVEILQANPNFNKPKTLPKTLKTLPKILRNR
uniref:Uncharacterized protein n=1 Tax=Romanomermis culicivorax TaxID=13658 RepID=A0A915J4S9_ROMCU